MSSDNATVTQMAGSALPSRGRRNSSSRSLIYSQRIMIGGDSIS
jgi:hypothetical protein